MTTRQIERSRHHEHECVATLALQPAAKDRMRTARLPRRSPRRPDVDPILRSDLSRTAACGCRKFGFAWEPAHSGEGGHGLDTPTPPVGPPLLARLVPPAPRETAEEHKSHESDDQPDPEAPDEDQDDANDDDDSAQR